MITSNKVIGTSLDIKVNDKMAKISPILFSSLSLLKRDVSNNWDGLIIVTGAVGTGKSTLATTIAGIWELLFQRELTIDNFTWKPEGIIEFTDRDDNETQVIVMDEAIQGATGKDSLTKIGNALKVTLVTKRRKKHLYLLLVDEVQELSKKVISRSSFMIDCRTILRKGEKERGYFKVYDKQETTQIYWLLKKYLIKSISEYKGKSKPFYKFWDNKDIFVSDSEYEEKKIQETKQSLSDEEDKISWSKIKIECFFLWSQNKITNQKKDKDIADIMGVKQSTFRNWVTDFKKCCPTSLNIN